MPYSLVPFATAVDAWTHHWFLWLPHHPLYESVEVASREPDQDGQADVWAWFTERAGSKRQIHYRNDPRLAKFVSGTCRPIAHQISGEDERPRNHQVTFDDLENVLVTISMQFDPGQRLTRQGAGLTDQSGHMSDRAFLLFHRDTNALARAGEAFVGTRNYTFGPDDDQGGFPFKWAYSPRVSIGLILYNSLQVTFGPQGFEPSPETKDVYVMNRAWGGGVSLRSDQAGQVRDYTDRSAKGDFLRVVFDPPLPPWGRSRTAILVVFDFHGSGRRSREGQRRNPPHRSRRGARLASEPAALGKQTAIPLRNLGPGQRFSAGLRDIPP